MTWFETLTGVSEHSPDHVRTRLQQHGTRLLSLANHRSLEAGQFSTPTLEELRQKSNLPSTRPPQIQVSELVGDVQALHRDPTSENAVFQVASQFNCLEMAAPHMTPEHGVGIYQQDWTQGPACSISAGAGTICRNYFVQVNGRTGQTWDNQIDCLSDLGTHFSSEPSQLWAMQNGYCFPTPSGLKRIEDLLSRSSREDRDTLAARLRVGVQSRTQVTLDDCRHLVTQVFCSALPIAYSEIPAEQWHHFPQLILDAAYEATFHVAWQNFRQTDCRRLYLTLVGGGVFGNNTDWILSSIDKALHRFSATELDVFIVSFGRSQPQVRQLVSAHRNH